MFRPEDPLAPREPMFKEPWHAQALALADSLVRAEAFTATEWAEALGVALKVAEAQALPDDAETYYTVVVAALETLKESFRYKRSGAQETMRCVGAGLPIDTTRPAGHACRLIIMKRRSPSTRHSSAGKPYEPPRIGTVASWHNSDQWASIGEVAKSLDGGHWPCGSQGLKVTQIGLSVQCSTSL